MTPDPPGAPGPLEAPARLAALERSGLMSRSPDAFVDELVELVSDALDAPVALVSLVAGDAQFFKGARGLAEPWAGRRETPLSHSFCRLVVETDAVVRIDDALLDARAATNPAIEALRVRAYLGAPLRSPDGRTLGAVCAIDGEPRAWSARDARVVERLAQLLTGELAAREALRAARDKLASAPGAEPGRVSRVAGEVLALIATLAPDGTVTDVNRPALELAALDPEDVIGRRLGACWWWAHDPEAQARLTRALARAAAGETVRYDERARGAPGTLVTIDFQLFPVRDPDGRIVELVASAVDVTERKAVEARLETLVHELNHRIKNSLATIQAMASQTLRHTDGEVAFRTAFTGRLRAIAAAHDNLVGRELVAGDLRALVRAQVGPYAEDGARLDLEGPDLVLGADAAHALGLVLHELATNAAKYGALSNDAGRVALTWALDAEASPTLATLDWRESDGPIVRPPARTGFGTRLIRDLLMHSLGGSVTLDYRADGLRARLRAPAGPDGPDGPDGRAVRPPP